MSDVAGDDFGGQTFCCCCCVLLPPLQKNKCNDNINDTKRAISPENIADFYFAEKRALPTFRENVRFLNSMTFIILTATSKLSLLLETSARQVKPDRLGNDLSHHLILWDLSMNCYVEFF